MPHPKIQNALSRWTHEHWFLAGVFSVVGTMVIAIAPGMANAMREPVAIQQEENVSLVLPKATEPQSADAGSGWHYVLVKKGQTLTHVFKELGLPLKSMRQMMVVPGARKDMSKIGPGKELAFELNAKGELKTLRFDRDENTRIELTLEDGKAKENIIQREVEQEVAIASGVIKKSFSFDAKQAGLTTSSINKLADVFKYDIDFVEDLNDGDTFHVVYEDQWREGQRMRNGAVLAARIVTRGKTYTAYRFNKNGEAQYFDQNGNPLKKVLMRIPIEFGRLSSTFGMRNHPVLGRMRMHKGVDYAARNGTPIMAAGDGRVSFVGWKNGYGRAVVIDHGQGRSTLYGHMSAFGKYKMGAHVNQGVTIGYVGASGLATGPHLHYEFMVNKQQVNPLKVTMPKPLPLSGPQLASFKATIAPSIAKMDSMERGLQFAKR
ncbi:MAG: peptidoglycan DD-metalloendopeptidase family protein [Arenimonas sp.]